VRYLLDTHVWLWMAAAPERLGPQAAEIISDPEIRLLLSAASSWEIAIKSRLGRLELPEPAESYVPDRMRILGVVDLQIDQAHALAVAPLPLHHRDPFDRMLIAQARVEGIPVITADAAFDNYDVTLVHAR